MLRAPRTLLGAVVTVAGLLLVTAGCGGGDDTIGQARDYAKKDGSDIAADARTAMAGLHTMHVAGTYTWDDKSVELDLSVAKDGTCSGTIGVGNGSVELRSVDGQGWYKPDLGFWKAEVGAEAASVAKAVGDRWIVLSGEMTSLRSFCSIDTLAGGMLDRKATVESEGAAMVGTRPTARVLVTRGGVDSVAYVQASDPHYVLRLTAGSGKRKQQVDFSAFDEKFDVEAPKPRDVFDPATAQK